MDFADDHRRGDRIKCDQGLAGAADGHPWENGGEPALTAIPGSVVSVLAGTYLACGMIVKNSIGITGILILSGICLIPIIKLFLLMFTVRITTALIQPMGDKRYVDGTTALANGIGMLMQALASALVLFIITLAIMSGATNGIGG